MVGLLGDVGNDNTIAVLEQYQHVMDSEAGLQAEILSLYIRRPYDLTDKLHNVDTLTDELVRHLRVITEDEDLPPEMTVEQLAVVTVSSLFGVLAVG